MDRHTWSEFPGGVSWTPQSIRVQGRNDKQTVCVLAQDGFHYRVYDLDDHGNDVDLSDATSES